MARDRRWPVLLSPILAKARRSPKRLSTLLLLAPARLPAPTSTIVSIGDGDGILNRDLGVQVDWSGCNCKVSPTEFEIAPGQALPARVTVPAKLVAKGVAGAKKGEAVSVIWQGGDRWLVRHEPSGKQPPWRWQTQPAERKKK